MLIAEARPLLKDMKTAHKELEHDMKLFKALENHILEILQVAETKLEEANKTYDLVKLMQDRIEDRLEMLMDSMKTAHKLWERIERTISNVGMNLKDIL
jgi:hypothetical protein